MYWQTSRFFIDLRLPQVMGIVNATPDSFSDGGAHSSVVAACAHCDQLLRDGAQLLDIGGESTRPGAAVVPLDVELARVLPVVRYAVTLGVPVSVDTYKPAVMRAVLDLGADIVNDIWALRWPGTGRGAGAEGEGEGEVSALQVVAEHRTCGVCLMHMHRDPQTMQIEPMVGDVVPQVVDFLQQQAQTVMAAGVAGSRICLDPGIGFGKTVAQNFALLARQSALLTFGFPLLAGWSRKSSLAALPGFAGEPDCVLEPRERVAPSVAAAVLAVCHGAAIVRVHDVRETVQALAVVSAMRAQATA